MVPENFAGFRLIRPLGNPGAFGQTFEAEREGQRFALKVLHESFLDSVDAERFRREVKALQLASSEHLVRCVDWGQELSGGRTYHWIAMPYVDGRTLREELKAAGGRFQPARARLIARGIALGLQALHELQIVHRDVKPENILITSDGVAQLLDMGLVRFLDRTTLTQQGALVGTPAYAAPEQLRGEPDIGSDLYALGVVLFELLAGRRPFINPDIAGLINAVLNEVPEPPSAFVSGIPPSLDDIVLRLLEKEPLRRPATAVEVAEELKPALAAAPPAREPYPRDAEPLIFVRAGDADVDDAVNGMLRGDIPTGLVIGITERAALVPGRKGARGHDAHFVVDPLLLRTAFPNFSRTRALRDLPYAPEGVAPWQPDDLRVGDASDELARRVITEQHNCGATVLLSANFAVQSFEDPWLKRCPRLLDASLSAAAAYGKPLFAMVAASLDFLCSESAVLQLANRVRRGHPDGYWMMLDTLVPPGAETQALFALRLALLLQDTGVPVVLSRVGTLRHLFLACGAGGVDIGLGRNDGFRLSDWRGMPRQGGPGRPPARFEFPSLLCTLPREAAEAVLASGLVDESSCDCNACLLGKTVEGKLARTAEHNMAVLARERRHLTGMPVAERIGALRDAIQRAHALGRRLRRISSFNDRLEHLRVFGACLDEVERTGLLQPGRAARRAS